MGSKVMLILDSLISGCGMGARRPSFHGGLSDIGGCCSCGGRHCAGFLYEASGSGRFKRIREGLGLST